MPLRRSPLRRTAVVTGGGSPRGIGRALAGRLAEHAGSVAVLGDLVVDRLGTVDDVAAVVEFLLGEDAGYITDATYNVNGGLIID